MGGTKWACDLVGKCSSCFDHQIQNGLENVAHIREKHTIRVRSFTMGKGGRATEGNVSGPQK